VLRKTTEKKSEGGVQRVLSLKNVAGVGITAKIGGIEIIARKTRHKVDKGGASSKRNGPQEKGVDMGTHNGGDDASKNNRAWCSYRQANGGSGG